MLNTNIHLSKSLSVEAEALHRQIRSHQEWKVTYSPPLVFPNGTTLTSFTSSSTGTEFSWEFPVLGKYQIFASKLNPFIEAGRFPAMSAAWRTPVDIRGPDYDIRHSHGAA